MDSIDRLVACLESLEKLLMLKRRQLQKDCQQLEILFKPWPLERQRGKGQKNTDTPGGRISPNTNKSDQTEPPLTDKSDADIELEMAKADKLLEKIQHLRCTVNDKEVRGVCNLKDSNAKASASKSIQKESGTQITASNQVAAKKPIKEAAKKLSAINRKQPASTKTTYTASYKAPRVPASAARRIGHAQTGTATAKNVVLASNSASRQQDGQTRSTINISQKSVSVNGDPEAHATERGSGKGSEQLVAFTLQQQGHQLKVPRSMRHLTKLNRKLRSTLDSRTSQQHVIPDRLTSYFHSIEQTNIMLY